MDLYAEMKRKTKAINFQTGFQKIQYDVRPDND